MGDKTCAKPFIDIEALFDTSRPSNLLRHLAAEQAWGTEWEFHFHLFRFFLSGIRSARYEFVVHKNAKA